MFPFRRIVESHARVVTKIGGFALALSATAPLRAQTPVQFGDIITEPGVYFLAGNQSGSGRGIQIESSDVTLLLLRFTLRGDGTDHGILNLGYDRVAIYGGRVTNFGIGIYLSGGEDKRIEGARVDHCDGAGIHVQNSYESSFVRLLLDCNRDDGIQAFNVYESRFLSIRAHDNLRDGIAIANQAPGTGEGNKVKLCWSAGNGRAGIRVADSSDNEISRNQCVDNVRFGIWIENFLSAPTAAQGDSADNNRVISNWCVFNGDGIHVFEGPSNNTIRENIALANVQHDLVDDNAPPPCANTWFLNTFLTRGGDGALCIF